MKEKRSRLEVVVPRDIQHLLVEAQKKAVGEVLTFGEVALPPQQFRAFKKLVFEAFHERLKPETIRILQSIDQVGAVPHDDNFDGKEC